MSGTALVSRLENVVEAMCGADGIAGDTEYRGEEGDETRAEGLNEHTLHFRCRPADSKTKDPNRFSERMSMVETVKIHLTAQGAI